MRTIEEREKALKKREIRNRIYDLFVVCIVLGLTFYNAIEVRKANETCRRECEAVFLGIDPEWLDEMRLNQTLLNETLLKINKINMSGVK